MIYEYICRNCHTHEERQMTVSDFDQNGRNQMCKGCHKPLTLRITGGRRPFTRSPFPKGIHEHIDHDPRYIRDKHEAVDVAASNGLTSVLCENWR